MDQETRDFLTEQFEEVMVNKYNFDWLDLQIVGDEYADGVTKAMYLSFEEGVVLSEKVKLLRKHLDEQN